MDGLSFFVTMNSPASLRRLLQLAQPARSLGVTRTQLERAFEVRNRVGFAAGSGQRGGKIEMELRRIRPQFERGFKLLDTVLEPALAAEGLGPVVPDAG